MFSDKRRDDLPGAVDQLEEVAHADFSGRARKTGHVGNEYRAFGTEPVPDSRAGGFHVGHVSQLGKVRDQPVEIVVPGQWIHSIRHAVFLLLVACCRAAVEVYRVTEP